MLYAFMCFKIVCTAFTDELHHGRYIPHGNEDMPDETVPKK
jgi:hypothetical protein